MAMPNLLNKWSNSEVFPLPQEEMMQKMFKWKPTFLSSNLANTEHIHHFFYLIVFPYLLSYALPIVQLVFVHKPIHLVYLMIHHLIGKLTNDCSQYLNSMLSFQFKWSQM